MDLFQALALGVLQGVTEFLPISSSGHLIFVPKLLGWPDHSLTFDLALHVGTAAALLAYFWRDWGGLAGAFFSGMAHPHERGYEWRMCWLLLLGSVPAAVAGVLFEEPIERLLRHTTPVAVAMILVAITMWLADRFSRRQRTLTDLRPVDAVLIGLAQALALWPGVSRSGATITAGRALGMSRDAAARFSFLLATPVTVGAASYKLLKELTRGTLTPDDQFPFLVGASAALVVGVLSIGFLLRFLRRNPLTAFVLYRLALGMLLLAQSLR